MPYFADHLAHVRHRVALDGQPGLRKAQIGGIYAIASHFIVNRDPALVVMPTGTGKTGVLMLVPYFRSSNRALIITPSKLVRNQVAEDFRSLSVLKRAEVFTNDVSGPRVFELASQVTSPGDWEQMLGFDVVVATPNGISPAYENIPSPPPDLFDLLLIDEAHHSPANTWKTILDCFPNADKVLFTATPYRQDSREIKGKFIFNYPVRAAFEDKVFGQVRFCPVEPAVGQNADIAIAKAAEDTFQKDKAAGYRHAVMVRTSQIKRANELADLYAANTSLKLQTVSSHHTYGHVKRTIEKLRNGELDGVICVDMMSEGFDFPWLKIAAVHSPHKSLAVTLQFIGRFARTNAPDIGEAKFLAVPQEIKGELQVLYEEKAIWQDIILDLQHGRIEQEKEVREAIESFDEPVVTDVSAEDLSLYSLRPYSHVKIYRVEGSEVDISKPLKLPRPFQVIFQQVSEELATSVIVANETEQPKWTDLPAFNRSEFDLFVTHFNADAGLLFINASRKSDSLYEEIAKQYSGGNHKILPLYIVNRVLHGMAEAEFFNVGMKNRVAHSHAESYRIISGPRAQRSVSRSDGKLFHCGHLFGKGKVADESVTIGFSSASKIWSNQNLQIPQLITWCKELSRRFAIEGPLPKCEGLDNLPVGQKLKSIPEGLVVALWPECVYDHHYSLRYQTHKGTAKEIPITEAELALVRKDCTDKQIVFNLEAEGFSFPVRFRLDGDQFFESVEANRAAPQVLVKAQEHDLLIFLNNNPVTFLTATYSIVRGDEYVHFSTSDLQPLDDKCLAVRDWAANSVDICCEFEGKKKRPRKGHVSIHADLWSLLDDDKYLAVLYDHRVNEAADFITLTEDVDRIVVGLYHCKASGDDKPGDRVEDLYEVCGQAVKCLIWVENEPDLLDHIRRRAASGSQFVRGNFKAVKAAFEKGSKSGMVYEVWLVQPGITKKGLSKKAGEILAASRDYLLRSGVSNVYVMVST